MAGGHWSLQEVNRNTCLNVSRTRVPGRALPWRVGQGDGFGTDGQDVWSLPHLFSMERLRRSPGGTRGTLVRTDIKVTTNFFTIFLPKCFAVSSAPRGSVSAPRNGSDTCTRCVVAVPEGAPAPGCSVTAGEQGHRSQNLVSVEQWSEVPLVVRGPLPSATLWPVSAFLSLYC